MPQRGIKSSQKIQNAYFLATKRFVNESLRVPENHILVDEWWGAGGGLHVSHVLAHVLICTYKVVVDNKLNMIKVIGYLKIIFWLMIGGSTGGYMYLMYSPTY